ncbi:MAG: hypothetical protein C5B60_11605 [Chloroflexi bacterium]|nr:MAG: hypothetical protein C5B60_11605 [Chloroflexota bacterium]
MGGRKARRTRIKEEENGRETVVLPMVTLPTIPSVRAARRPEDDLEDDYASQGQEYLEYGDDPNYGGWDDPNYGGWDDPNYPDEPIPETRMVQRYRADTVARPLHLGQHKQPAGPGSSKAVERYNKEPHPFDVYLVPGRKNLSRHLPPGMQYQVNRVVDQLDIVRRNKTLLVVLALVVVLTSTLVAVSNTTSVLGDINQADWGSLMSGEHVPPTPTPPPAPDITAAGHYVSKYGFDWPGAPQAIPGDERSRIVFMLPYAYRAAAAYDRRYHNSIEPEMLVWWTHAEGIGAHINYSNCANLGTRPGTSYFTDIENCSQSGFWQLGYGNQFSVIYVLKNAFTDMYGDPNNATLVQKVGQWVLNFDAKQGTVPACGGYSCTFPRLTIDQIMSGVDETAGVVTADNWWASVLSRDPAINCYMVAHALSFFNHAATLNWVGCYYYEPCWGYESNRLGDILAAWAGLRQAAHI